MDEAGCPSRFQINGNIHFCQVPPEREHQVHTNMPNESPYHGLRKTWMDSTEGAFQVVVPAVPADGLPERTSVATVDGSCANRICPNRAGEGRFTVMTVHATRARAARDVVLILCAPCAEYLGRMVR